jgi:periplasmic protein TonB
MAVSTSSADLFQPESQHRALLACVAASIALHAGALVAFPELRGRAAPAPIILTATLSPVAPREAAPDAREEPRPKPPRAAPPVPRPAVARPAPAPAEAPDPAPEAGKPEAPVVPPVAEAAPVARALSEAPTPPAQAWDPATLQQYRTGLIAFARQFKRYPAQAMERGWEGRVEIRITVRPTGTIDSARVKTPSGYQILDDQALDMVKRALARTPLPPALLGREFSVDIPVIFELQG